MTDSTCDWPDCYGEADCKCRFIKTVPQTIDSSSWTGRDSTSRIRIGFKGKNQLPLLMVWTEYWNEEQTDVVHATADVVIDFDHITWFGHVWIAPWHRPKPYLYYQPPSRNVLEYLHDKWWWFWAFNNPMAKCKVCGKKDDVAFFDPRGIWAFPLRSTICMKCCEDHDFNYVREERDWQCTHCGTPAPLDWMADHHEYV